MPAKFKIGKLVVIGVGLIGGSFALALKQAKAVKHVVGVGRTRRNLAAALKLGIIDEAHTDAARAVAGADLVLLCTPVGQMPEVMARIAPHLSAHTVISDGGSISHVSFRRIRLPAPKKAARLPPLPSSIAAGT
jgi:prephenate dehydrogenase